MLEDFLAKLLGSVMIRATSVWQKSYSTNSISPGRQVLSNQGSSGP
jgi:hypothetical protein